MISHIRPNNGKFMKNGPKCFLKSSSDKATKNMTWVFPTPLYVIEKIHLLLRVKLVGSLFYSIKCKKYNKYINFLYFYKKIYFIYFFNYVIFYLVLQKCNFLNNFSGFIDFIVEPSLSVCGDLLDKITSLSSTPATPTISEEPHTGQFYNSQSNYFQYNFY